MPFSFQWHNSFLIIQLELIIGFTVEKSKLLINNNEIDHNKILIKYVRIKRSTLNFFFRESLNFLNFYFIIGWRIYQRLFVASVSRKEKFSQNKISWSGMKTFYLGIHREYIHAYVPILSTELICNHPKIILHWIACK